LIHRKELLGKRPLTEPTVLALKKPTAAAVLMAVVGVIAEVTMAVMAVVATVVVMIAVVLIVVVPPLPLFLGHLHRRQQQLWVHRQRVPLQQMQQQRRRRCA
jgi:uncharacterized membrane protein